MIRFITTTIGVLCLLLAGNMPVARAEQPAPRPIRLPASATPSETSVSPHDDVLMLVHSDTESNPLAERLQRLETTDRPEWLSLAKPSDKKSAKRFPIQNSFAEVDPGEQGQVVAIPAYVPTKSDSHRMVRYDVPLNDAEAHRLFVARGVDGQLLSIEKEVDRKQQSLSDRLRGFMSPATARAEAEKVHVVRYEVPADDIQFHAVVSPLGGEILEPGILQVPEVRFFQPKARVFMDLKSDNDGEFDLFDDGAILASLDVVELYFPMPLISDRFGELFGRPSQLSGLGWRFGGTIGLGITTALNNGAGNGHAPVTSLSSGLRYEFPLGRPSRELIETRDMRLDQRTRVGIEVGLQGGVSTREGLQDKTDLGMYFGLQVNTPWGG